MNDALTEEITYHILANLGVLPSTFVNLEKTRSLIDQQFLLPNKVSFEFDSETKKQNVYGCQISITDGKEFKILLADCSQEKEVPEYALLVQLKDAPAFGIYLSFNRLVNDPPEAEPMIAVMSDKNWLPCTVYLQATFLAGMEQLRDLCVRWSKVKDYDTQYQNLLDFISFHSNYYGSYDEGQES